jgi:hypothetical protein
MSPSSTSAEQDRWGRVPAWVRPRAVELRGSGQVRLIETTLLVLVGLVLAIATVNDVVRQTHINQRLLADERTWRGYTGHDYHNLSIDQELFGSGSDREVVCGNTSPGPPQARTQICLEIWGSVVNGRRTVQGGWYLPAHDEEDLLAQRHGCFGPASAGLCPR